MFHSRDCTKRPSGRQRLAAMVAPLLLACCGCPVAPAPSDGTSGANTSTGNGSTASGQVQQIDPGTNTSIASAASLTFGSNGEIRFESTIHRGSDVDVFQLGTLQAGDRVVADIQAQNGNLDAVAAIFDSNSDVVAFNDDRTPDSSDLNPLIDFIVRGATGPYFLAVIDYPGSNTTGMYLADVQIQHGVGVPAPHNQIVYLNWRGGANITIPNVGTYNLSPFSAADVGLPTSQTSSLKDQVEQIVKTRYSGFDLTVLSSDHDAEPGTPHSTVYFGGNDPQAFAVSQEIDPYNANPSDSTIVFTQSFLDAFSHPPSFNEMATAIGDTVAHEVGHLLGLVHTADGSDLMDTSSSNDRLLQPQQFKTAPLDASVFPFGFQDSRDLLTWTLGLLGM